MINELHMQLWCGQDSNTYQENGWKVLSQPPVSTEYIKYKKMTEETQSPAFL